MRFAGALLTLLLLPQVAAAAPRWASQPDSKSAEGHTFTCEGTGASEEEATQAAAAICNDKICKVCGVEVLSVTVAQETLKGVEFSRRVEERCRRIRKGASRIARKSTDCDHGVCSAWIEIFYSRQDEQDECPAYSKENFADPAACEADVDAFRSFAGTGEDAQSRTPRYSGGGRVQVPFLGHADSFRKRTAILDDALGHCSQIDVRPTPAMMALDQKLATGMSAFEVGDDWPWSPYLAGSPSLRLRIAESKLLSGRLHLVRDYVGHLARVFAALEAMRLDESSYFKRSWDSPEGVEQIRVALAAVPPGNLYGLPDVHFAEIDHLSRGKSSLKPLSALLRSLYPPQSLAMRDEDTPGPRVDASLASAAQLFIAGGHLEAAEWDYALQAHKANECLECLRALLEVPDHGTPQLRLQHFLQAWDARGKPRKDPLQTLLRVKDVGFALEAEQALPVAERTSMNFNFLQHLEYIGAGKATPEVRDALRRRMTRAVLEELAGGDPSDPNGLRDRIASCNSLPERLRHLLPESNLPATSDQLLIFEHVCRCLTRVLSSDRDQGYAQLRELANGRRLTCGGK